MSAHRTELEELYEKLHVVEKILDMINKQAEAHILSYEEEWEMSANWVADKTATALAKIRRKQGGG